MVLYPEIYDRILAEGHSVGNHTQNHLSGWKVSDEAYLNDVIEAGRYIKTNLFRPPYGRATRFQMKCLRESGLQMKMVMCNLATIMEMPFGRNRGSLRRKMLFSKTTVIPCASHTKT